MLVLNLQIYFLKMGWKDSLIYFLEENRGLVVLVFCLPASFIFDLILQVRNWFYQQIFSSPDYHDRRVKTIQDKVIARPQAKERLLLCTVREWFISSSLVLATPHSPFTKCIHPRRRWGTYSILFLVEL